ncbi:MAG: hypothetical protein K8E66_05110, partial [Phycisphaerales bacterium]|nr:hypothetical protein [Phycisphaerales bacterium]
MSSDADQGFRHATAAALRAVAAHPELEVSFGATTPVLDGRHASMPAAPVITPGGGDRAWLRGHADR